MAARSYDRVFGIWPWTVLFSISGRVISGAFLILNTMIMRIDITLGPFRSGTFPDIDNLGPPPPAIDEFADHNSQSESEPDDDDEDSDYDEDHSSMSRSPRLRVQHDHGSGESGGSSDDGSGESVSDDDISIVYHPVPIGTDFFGQFSSLSSGNNESQ